MFNRLKTVYKVAYIAAKDYFRVVDPRYALIADIVERAHKEVTKEKCGGCDGSCGH